MIGDANIPQNQQELKGSMPVYTMGLAIFVIGTMLQRFTLVFLALAPICAYGQYGLNIRYLVGQSDILEETRISQDGIYAGLEYHTRLKQNRLEFHPALGYRFTFNDSAYDGYLSAFDLDLNTSIYPFDFEGDCDCPTFSKDGNLVKKGFFFEVAPGVSYQLLKRIKSDPDDPSKLPISSKNVVLKLSGAAGLDIGITDHYTLTPMFSATWLSADEWEGLQPDGSSGTLDDAIYMGFGLRLTYTEDTKRRRK